VAVDRALDYLMRVDPEFAATVREPFLALKRPKAEWAALPAETTEKTTVAIAETIARFDEKKADYAAKSSETEWSAARQCAVVARQAEEILRTSRFALRDRAMADNVKWILDQAGPDAKIVLWAHNGHASASGFAGVESMGVHLRRQFGGAMVVIGCAFGEGGFQAIEMPYTQGSKLKAFAAPPAPAGSLDAALAATGLPFFILDLRKLPATGPVSDWFAAEHATRSIGAAYSSNSASAFFAPQSIEAEYDALFFAEKTTRARPTASVRKRFGMDAEDTAPAK
jgi:erythromycin esterase